MEKYISPEKFIDLFSFLDQEVSLSCFEKEDFFLLSEKKKKDVGEKILLVAEDGDQIYYSASSSEEIDEIYAIIKKNSRWSKANAKRKEREKTKSTGIYTNQDIKDIYRIQNGYCYYTGERISFNPRTFSIDHIIPVSAGGSFWPLNIALCLKSANSVKKDRSKLKYLNQLEREKGKDWRIERSIVIKEIDKKRKVINENRIKEISDEISEINQKLCELYNKNEVKYHLLNRNDVQLLVDDIEINFPAGFLRKSAAYNNYQYINNIVKVILSK
ncbi:HNH endonuclease domain-containing protein [Thalassotalea sp. PP2-459]|uniref:HNH endonuclease domain-containing protein n=1 Tax=Thalassotalea sp. PP2-459 TaxID=1742724 RepID=UPI0009456BD2|nr:HNH endonuclease domain-containing protein [Thalassotalea sp. PP2-459]OKY25234.1 hypothetical protein BI291_17185 [Thalassotalea sp. PP2-459]